MRDYSNVTQVAAAAKATEAEPAKPSLLDEVIANTKQPNPEKQPVPTGYRELPAGVKRLIRMNVRWLREGEGKPFIVMDEHQGYVKQFYDVLILGPARLVCKEGKGCGVGNNSGWMETEAALHVR